MPMPEAVRWRARKVGLDLSLRSSGAAQATTRRSAAVSRATEMIPSAANRRKMWRDSAAMNCGMKGEKMREAGPAYLTVRKAMAEAARIAETPSAAAKTWKSPPKNVPKED